MTVRKQTERRRRSASSRHILCLFAAFQRRMECLFVCLCLYGLDVVRPRLFMPLTVFASSIVKTGICLLWGCWGANKSIYLFPVRSVQRFHFPPIGSPLLEVLRIPVRQLLSFFKHAAEDTNYPSSPKGRFFFFCSKTLMSEMRLNESRSSNKN